ncbi:hypothetical protein DRM94_12090 [Aeromonas taiwanensis]|uniref:Uncharacterized protein n=1 Tax=Aeromonas taiwanensis TaxID=633417 RepID=A0A5F0K9Q7_9GAMM|nr:hypothetical protein DRM93_12090 [Aeromonas taiwanensis]TFF76171.1 hypothetical protein DRM95_11705 [Aeromonas taiwanensis]TFF79269.1 hypothetical protein DRM94_12090 [Aeromonas taiwanensis]
MGHQQDAEIPEASLFGEMAKKQMLRSLICATVASLACRGKAGKQNPAKPGSVCVQIMKILFI